MVSRRTEAPGAAAAGPSVGAVERRVCVEFLPPDELARAEVRVLLRHAGVAPMLAAPARPRADGAAAQAEADEAVAQALKRYRDEGLRPCVWPLLPDEDGYWPSARNAERACARVRALLSAAEAAGAPFGRGDVIAIDLEPPLWDARRHRLGGCDAASFASASAHFRGLRRELAHKGLRTLAIAYPLVSADDRGTYWQRRCVAPLGCGWDRVAIMTYSSMVAGYSRGLLDVAAARRYGYRAQAALGAAFPGRAGAFVGICGRGKLGDEPAHEDPEALRLDVAAARAAGAVEVTAFCLEGILQSKDPYAWLAALSAPPLAPPISLGALRGDAVHALLKAVARLPDLLSGVGGA